MHDNPLGRALLGQADAITMSKAVDALRSALKTYETPDGVFLDSAALLVTAHR
ncbi:hypothetical protein [Actinoallomurus sp. CA-150999]|uniref:hypothetical protein n=1 Tax=Actinoallomurus sp. CA-150999 TaxID=3239887 RepID=UPI003D8D3B8B